MLMDLTVCKLTCTSAHAPGRQSVRCGEAVEHANITRRQELHKLAVFELVFPAVQDSCRLLRYIHDLPRDERHRDGKNVL